MLSRLVNSPSDNPPPPSPDFIGHFSYTDARVINPRPCVPKRGSRYCRLKLRVTSYTREHVSANNVSNPRLTHEGLAASLRGGALSKIESVRLFSTSRAKLFFIIVPLTPTLRKNEHSEPLSIAFELSPTLFPLAPCPCALPNYELIAVYLILIYFVFKSAPNSHMTLIFISSSLIKHVCCTIPTTFICAATFIHRSAIQLYLVNNRNRAAMERKRTNSK